MQKLTGVIKTAAHSPKYFAIQLIVSNLFEEGALIQFCLGQALKRKFLHNESFDSKM